MSSFYRRPLPDSLVAFSSLEGRALFREALADGTLEGWFAQAEQLHTQQDPAFCGLATLVVALNALAIDPGRTWKGPWRWYSEELLDCCAPLDLVRERGITLDQFACLARCNGASAKLSRASEATLEVFRREVEEASRSPEGLVLAAAYSRRVLGQTGEGHFSTVAGYHRGTDRALLLDVARFKYPPHWVPLPLLFEAMTGVDAATGKSRGWVALRRGEFPPLAYRLSPGSASWDEIGRALEERMPKLVADASDARAAIHSFLSGLPEELRGLVGKRALDDRHHEEMACEVVDALRATDAHARVREAGGDDVGTILFLLAPDVVFASLPVDAREEIAAARRLDRLPDAARREVERLRTQLATAAAG